MSSREIDPHQEAIATEILTDLRKRKQYSEKEKIAAEVLSSFKHIPQRKKPSVFEHQLQVINQIRRLADTRGIFTDLLYTHNTIVPTFVKMLTGEYHNIRCCHNDSPIGFGAQFRYGLDSQYGEVKIIMKPNFWAKYSKGVSLKQKIVDHPVFADLFQGIEYSSKDPVLSYILSMQAKNFNFRHLDQLLGLENQGGMTCYSATEKMVQNYQSRVPSQLLDKPYPSWCNIQLHLGENVDFNDISLIIVPGYLKNPDLKIMTRDGKTIPIHQIIDDANTRTGIPNPFKGKIVYSSEVPPEEYYSLLDVRKIIAKADIETTTYYQTISQMIKESGKSLSPPDYMQRKSVMMWGNTSPVAVSPQIFREETQLYMIQLVENNLI
jgi:hypothetical protein